MNALTRREFLTRAPLAAGAVLAAGGCTQAAEPSPKSKEPKSGADLVALGKTGIQTSRLGMGTGTNGVGRSSHQQRLGQEAFTRLVRHALDRGIRYFDTADQYGMHLFLRSALRGVPRDKVFLQTKTRATHPEVAKADIERFREELGTPYIDSLLLHCMTTSLWPADMRPVMDVLTEAKQQGWVRAVGISCHGIVPLTVSATCDWIDVQLARINPFGIAMDAPPPQVAKLLQTMHDAGRGILGMKICGGGRATEPQQRLESLRYVLGLGCVDAFTIGFESTQQIDEVLGQIEGIGGKA